MFDKMKQLMEMQKKMQEIKRELESAEFEVVSSDSLVRITMTAAQELKNISIEKELPETDKAVLEKSIKDAYNKALKRSREIAADKMKSITGLNLPGMTP